MNNYTEAELAVMLAESSISGTQARHVLRQKTLLSSKDDRYALAITLSENSDGVSREERRKSRTSCLRPKWRMWCSFSNSTTPFFWRLEILTASLMTLQKEISRLIFQLLEAPTLTASRRTISTDWI